jgi:predicted DNA-binding transcriptional regulator YafY
MPHPTTRVLAVLELLQSRGRISGPELAQRINVDVRTLRRYIVLLEELGIPITTERGRHGAYMLVAGFKLPPMMFTDDEAHALSLGLIAARGLGLSGIAPALASAEAKLDRVMPEALRERTAGMRASIALQDHPGVMADAQLLRDLCDAARDGRTTSLRYRAADGSETLRGFDVYGLVFRGGRWYVVGHCHLRRGLRTLRLDRVRDAERTSHAFERPRDFDAAAYLSQAMASLPRAFAFEVLLRTNLERARDHYCAMFGTLDAVVDGVRLRGSTDDLGWMGRQLIGLPFAAEVVSPDALKHALEEIVTDLARRHAPRSLATKRRYRKMQP